MWTMMMMTMEVPKQLHPAGIADWCVADTQKLLFLKTFTGTMDVPEVQQQSSCKEMRDLINDYTKTLDMATGTIKKLTQEKEELKKTNEEMLETNEGLLKELIEAMQKIKELQQEQQEVLAANDDLFNESQRLTEAEEEWISEKQQLQEQLALMATDPNAQNEKMVALENRVRELQKQLQDHDQNETLNKMQSQMKTLVKQLKVAKTTIRDLEQQLKQQQSLSPSSVKEEELADLRERNRLLTGWREQLVQKNQALLEDNHKLKEKCENLEALLNEEEINIGDVLKMINTLSMTKTLSLHSATTTALTHSLH